MKYPFIWRDTSSVRWDETERSLYVVSLNGFAVVDELRRIIKAVHDEYGDCLMFDDSTIFAVPTEAERTLRESAG